MQLHYNTIIGKLCNREGVKVNLRPGKPLTKGLTVYYYKFNIADWNLSTAHLGPAEEAVYFRLVNFYYDTETPIPLETRSVIRRLRLGNHSDTVSDMLIEFFTKTEKGWVHRRCEKVLTEYKKMSKRNKKNAALGGRPRTKRDSSKPSGNPVGFESDTSRIPNQEPLTTNQEPVKKTSPRFTRPTVDEIRAYCLERQNEIDPESFFAHYETNGWVQGKGKPVKNWKMAVITWEKSRNENSKGNTGQPKHQGRLSAGDRVRARAAERAGQSDGPITPALGGDG